MGIGGGLAWSAAGNDMQKGRKSEMKNKVTYEKVGVVI